MELDFQPILIALISGGVGGALITLFKPLVDWNIEKRRERRKERRKILDQLTKQLDNLTDFKFNENPFNTSTTIFLRENLNKEEQQRLADLINDMDQYQIKPGISETKEKKIWELRQIGLDISKTLLMKAIARYEKKYL